METPTTVTDQDLLMFKQYLPHGIFNRIAKRHKVSKGYVSSILHGRQYNPNVANSIIKEGTKYLLKHLNGQYLMAVHNKDESLQGELLDQINRIERAA